MHEYVAHALAEGTDSVASELMLQLPADVGLGGGDRPVCSGAPSSEPASERARSPARNSRAAAAPVSHISQQW